MKLLEAIKQLDKLSIDEWHLLQNCLENRKDWLEEREPESSGETYDNWEMKFEDWSELCELCEEIISGLKTGLDVSNEIEYLSDDILSFHYTHKGLSRLRL